MTKQLYEMTELELLKDQREIYETLIQMQANLRAISAEVERREKLANVEEIKKAKVEELNKNKVEDKKE